MWLCCVSVNIVPEMFFILLLTLISWVPWTHHGLAWMRMLFCSVVGFCECVPLWVRKFWHALWLTRSIKSTEINSFHMKTNCVISPFRYYIYIYTHILNKNRYQKLHGSGFVTDSSVIQTDSTIRIMVVGTKFTIQIEAWARVFLRLAIKIISYT